MNDEQTKPEPQVVGEVVLNESELGFAGPIDIIDTSPKGQLLTKGDIAALQYRLIIAQARLKKRQTKKLGRKENLLAKVNSLRKKLDMKTITLKEFNDGVR